MSEPKPKKPTRRTPGPKTKPTIPASFQISRHVNPMAIILNEAERNESASEPSQEKLNLQELTSETNIIPLIQSGDIHNNDGIEPLQDLNLPKISDPVQDLQPAQKFDQPQKTNPVQDLPEKHFIVTAQRIDQIDLKMGSAELIPTKTQQKKDVNKTGHSQHPSITDLKSTITQSTQNSSTAKATSKSMPTDKFAAGSNIVPTAIIEQSIKSIEIPIKVMDEVLPHLDHAEVTVYIRLFRLSATYGDRQCRVSVPTLALLCNCSENTIRATLKKLRRKGLISPQGTSNTGAKDGGTIFEIFQEIDEAYNTAPGTDNDPGANF